MEKPSPTLKSSSKNKFLKLLIPKAAVHAAVSFQNFSPRYRTHHSKVGFSGPMIPAEARGRSKSKTFEPDQEPTSPKVSCMGQIKHCKNKTSTKTSKKKPVNSSRPEEKTGKAKNIKIKGIKKMKSFASAKAEPPAAEAAPGLGQMRRFSSSRDTLAGFDWTAAQVGPEEEREYSDGEDDDVSIPFSAPLYLSGAGLGGAGGLELEPRKEINLWKRRTMAQPKPLQLNIDKEN